MIDFSSSLLAAAPPAAVTLSYAPYGAADQGSAPPNRHAIVRGHERAITPDVDAASKHAPDAGSKIVDLVEDKNWGDHCSGVEDSFGHIWYTATPIQDPPNASG